jgi:hypothetical protein
MMGLAVPGAGGGPFGSTANRALNRGSQRWERSNRPGFPIALE